MNQDYVVVAGILRRREGQETAEGDSEPGCTLEGLVLQTKRTQAEDDAATVRIVFPALQAPPPQWLLYVGRVMCLSGSTLRFYCSCEMD